MSAGRDRFRPPNHLYDHFLLTTVVGSYPKPEWLRTARERHERGEFSAADWAEAQDDAARLITEEHERAGLDVVVDGEMRRTEMVEYFAHLIDGYEFNGEVKVWGHNYFDKPSVVEPVSRDDPWLIDEFEFTDRIANSPVKVPITGPYTLASWSFNEHYEDTGALARALAELVADEITDLIAAGADYIQIDEPALATTPDDHEIVQDCLERIVPSLPAAARIGLHVCYGDYSRIYPEVLDFPIDELDIEQANHGFDQLETLTEPPFSKDLALGVIDVHDSRIESVEEIRENIIRGLEVVPPERLTISPDCGLKLLPREIASTKLENMVTAARSVEADLDAGAITADRTG